ncbi:MAG: hypothetical protein WHX93_04110 [bacterium]
METYYYPRAAMERAMKIQEVILRAMDGRLKWYEAAEILGVSHQQMRWILLFVDASTCRWIPALDGMEDLIVVWDYATTEVYYARLVPQESTQSTI